LPGRHRSSGTGSASGPADPHRIQANPHTITAVRMAGDAVPSQALRNLHGGRPINIIPL